MDVAVKPFFVSLSLRERYRERESVECVTKQRRKKERKKEGYPATPESIKWQMATDLGFSLLEGLQLQPSPFSVGCSTFLFFFTLLSFWS
ncbi:hypothetical protein AHAS_Ahas13G0087500 [Arachis hypogaea]